jgi:catechol 2,3-dioxygenase-like lactoylglutathione lyase family enzyme
MYNTHMRHKNDISNMCDHIGIFSHNAERLVNFYVDIVGFKKTYEGTLSKTIMKPLFGITQDCRFIKLHLGNTMLEIFEPIVKRKTVTKGYNHWGLIVLDRKKFVNKLKHKKVSIIEVKRNNHSVYFIADPDGNKIEIREKRS